MMVSAPTARRAGIIWFKMFQFGPFFLFLEFKIIVLGGLDGLRSRRNRQKRRRIRSCCSRLWCRSCPVLRRSCSSCLRSRSSSQLRRIQLRRTQLRLLRRGESSFLVSWTRLHSIACCFPVKRKENLFFSSPSHASGKEFWGAAATNRRSPTVQITSWSALIKVKLRNADFLRCSMSGKFRPNSLTHQRSAARFPQFCAFACPCYFSLRFSLYLIDRHLLTNQTIQTCHGTILGNQ